MFDASCSSRKGGSPVNDILHAGLLVTPLLFDVMCKFRSYDYAIVSGIEKAFLQIRLTEKTQRFYKIYLV